MYMKIRFIECTYMLVNYTVNFLNDIKVNLQRIEIFQSEFKVHV